MLNVCKTITIDLCLIIFAWDNVCDSLITSTLTVWAKNRLKHSGWACVGFQRPLKFIFGFFFTWFFFAAISKTCIFLRKLGWHLVLIGITQDVMLRIWKRERESQWKTKRKTIWKTQKKNCTCIHILFGRADSLILLANVSRNARQYSY